MLTQREAENGRKMQNDFLQGSPARQEAWNELHDPGIWDKENQLPSFNTTDMTDKVPDVVHPWDKIILTPVICESPPDEAFEG